MRLWLLVALFVFVTLAGCHQVRMPPLLTKKEGRRIASLNAKRQQAPFRDFRKAHQLWRTIQGHFQNSMNPGFAMRDLVDRDNRHYLAPARFRAVWNKSRYWHHFMSSEIQYDLLCGFNRRHRSIDDRIFVRKVCTTPIHLTRERAKKNIRLWRIRGQCILGKRSVMLCQPESTYYYYPPHLFVTATRLFHQRRFHASLPKVHPTTSPRK